MKSVTKLKAKNFLLILAIASFVIAALEGIIYYKQDNSFFKYLLVLQNCINAFAFKPSITISNATDRALPTGNVFIIAACYAYCIIVFTAPYCTMTFVYKFLENAFKMIFIVRKRRNRENVLIFGYNSDIEILLNNYNLNEGGGQKRSIHIITPETFSNEKKYEIVSKNYIIHSFDCLKATYEELRYIFRKVDIDRVTNVILFDEIAVQNFSLLQMFKLDENDLDEKITLTPGTKIICRCDDENVNALISDYYDNRTGKAAYYDLEIINLPELQIHSMFEQVPLYNSYKDSDKSPDEWDVNMLIVGFSNLGKETLLNTMNLGVFSKNNKITVDVIDYNIEEKAEIFANYLSEEMFVMDKDSFRIDPKTADGSFVINFYKLNVFHKQFRTLLKGKENTVPYNYVVIAIDDINISVRCAQEVEFALCKNGKKSVPIFVQMDSDKRLVNYIKTNKSILPNVMVIPEKSKVVSLDMILDKKTDKKSKEYNHFYSSLQILDNQTDTGSLPPEKNIEDEWISLTLFRRDSNRAAAYHETVKSFILERFAKEENKDVREIVEELVGKDGTLFKFNGSAWIPSETGENFVSLLKNEKSAYEIAVTEHRRWCYFLLSRGWRSGERNDKYKANPYLMPEDDLILKHPNMIKYDLMFLLGLYKNSQKNEGEKR